MTTSKQQLQQKGIAKARLRITGKKMVNAINRGKADKQAIETVAVVGNGLVANNGVYSAATFTADIGTAVDVVNVGRPAAAVFAPAGSQTGVATARVSGGSSSPSVSNSGTVPAHYLTDHLGTLIDTQAPQFLLVNGSRNLLGNLDVADGVTIDGVDLSAHADNVNAHHAKLHSITDATHHSVAGSMYSVVGLPTANTLGVMATTNRGDQSFNTILRSGTAGQLYVSSLYTPEIDTVSGNLLLNPVTGITNAYDTVRAVYAPTATVGAIVQNIQDSAAGAARAVIGYNARWNRTTDLWEMGALGTGSNDSASFLVRTTSSAIDVVFHSNTGTGARTMDHATYTAGTKFTFTNTGRLGVNNTSPLHDVDAAGSVRSGVSVITPLVTNTGNLSISPAGSTTIQGTSLSLSPTNAVSVTGASVTVSPTGSLSLSPGGVVTVGGLSATISPVGDLNLDPGGNIVTPVSQTIKTSNFNSSFPIAGFQFNENPLATGGSVLTIGKVVANELSVDIFVANEVRIDRGNQYWAKGFGILSKNYTTPATIGGTFPIWFENSAHITGALFSSDDWILLQQVDIDTGIVIESIWGQVADYLPSGNEQVWTFTLRSGSVNKLIKKGRIATNFGKSGQSLIHLSTVDATGAPYIRFRKWAGDNPYSPANYSTFTQIGDIGNLFGTTGEYGLFAGNGTGIDDQYLRLSSPNPTFSNIPISMSAGGVTKVKLDATNGLDMLLPGGELQAQAITWHETLGVGNPRVRIDAFAYGDSTQLIIENHAKVANPTGMISLQTYSSTTSTSAKLQLNAPTTAGNSTVFLIANEVNVGSPAQYWTTKIKLNADSTVYGALKATMGVDITGNAGYWTTSNWAKAVTMDQGHALVWEKGSTGYARGIGGSTDGVFYVARSTANDNSIAPTYDMIIDASGNVGIGVTPYATLDVGRGSGVNGTAVFRGTTYASHFNYSTTEDTYIRGGKSTSNVYINDTHAGAISMLMNRIQLRADDSATNFWIREDGANTVISTKVGSMYYGYNGNAALTHRFYPGGTSVEMMRVDSNGVSVANSISVANTYTLTRGASIGSTSTDYTPVANNWNSTGSTLLLNASDYSTIGFHDSNSRVDYIRVGGGVITLGYNGGFGAARVDFGGVVGSAWNNVTFGSGWGNYGGGWTSVQYKKVGDLVVMQGLIKRFSGSANLMFTLPSGFRPAANVMVTPTGYILGVGHAASRADIYPDGTCVFQTGGTEFFPFFNVVFSTV